MTPKPNRIDWNRQASLATIREQIPVIAPRLALQLPRVLRGRSEAILNALVGEITRLPKLLDCTIGSLFGAAIEASRLGLFLGPQLGEAFVLPYGKKATLVIGYRGFIQLAHRSGLVRRITPMTVREGDQFAVVRGTEQSITHYQLRNNTNPATDFYVVVELTSGGTDFEWMTYEEALAHRDRYAAARNAPDYVKNQSPWYDMTGGGFELMAQKTLVRRLAKRLPLTSDIAAAIRVDEAAETNEPQGLEAHLEGIDDELPPADGELVIQTGVVDEDDASELGRG